VRSEAARPVTSQSAFTQRLTALAGRATAPLRALALISVVVVMAVLFERAVFSFNAAFDYLWYHLPNALTWIGNRTFVPSSFVTMMRLSQPPLVEMVQGALIYITGRLEMANAFNLFALAACYTAIVVACRKSDVPIDPLTFAVGLLAIPLVLIQATSGYVDLFGNCGLLLALAGLRLVRVRWKISASFVFVGLLIAVYSRYSLWPAAAILFAVFAITSLLADAPRAPRLAVLACLGMLMASWSVKSTIEHGNPTYPYRPPFSGTLFTNYTHNSDTIVMDQAPERYRNLPRPLLFAISALEINRLLAWTTPYHWSVDMGFDPGIASPHFRLGGWGWATMLVLLAGFVFTIASSRSFPPEAIFLVAATAFTAIMPEGHELRYFLYIPMGLAFTCASYISRKPPLASNFYLIAILAALSLAVAGTGKLHFWHHKPAEFAAPETRAAWGAYLASDRSRPLCVSPVRPDAILWTGPALLQYPVKVDEVCDGLFARASGDR
jgi:hypothetical protein